MDDATPPEVSLATGPADREPTKRPLLTGPMLCGVSTLLLWIASMIAWALLTSSVLGADFDGGTHTAHAAVPGVLAFLLAILGAGTALVALVRGPLPARLGAVVLLLLGVPLTLVCGFVALITLG